MKLFETVFENEDFILLNKSAGLLSVPDRTQSSVSLKDLLKDKYGQIYTVHRLDRDTSGLILFAKKEGSHRYFSQSFENREVDKIYVGIVSGTPINPKGSIEEPIAEHSIKKGMMTIHKRGKESRTDYETLEEFGLYAFLRFQIFTGRTHQIRLHMKHMGYPILCDELYGNGQPVFISSIKRNYRLAKEELEERPILHRLGLHAQSLSFRDEQGNIFRFEAPLPKDLKALLQQLRKWQPHPKRPSDEKRF
jgi:23S rRNA pseudouridine1911/1915/1917 synthase